MSMRGAGWLLSYLHGMKIYRVVARKLIGMRVCYRFATLDDASALARLYGYDRSAKVENPVETFIDQISGLQDYGYILIASVGQQIVAATVLRWFSDDDTFYPDWWLFGMYVRPRYQAAGIGEGLVRVAQEKTETEGGTRINLLVFEQNTIAINFYHKLGFRPASIHGLDVELAEEAQRGVPRRIIMSKSL
jgi:ribosomal protein S18 acetylase RimI-like enzyme